jgi:hypothetical protein
MKRLTILALVLVSKLAVGQLEIRDYDFNVRSSKMNSTGNALNYEGLEINKSLHRITFERKVKRCMVDEKYNITDIKQTDGHSISYYITSVIDPDKSAVLVLFYIDDTYIAELLMEGGINLVLEEE